MTHRTGRAMAAAVVAILLTGCGFFRAAKVPMRTVSLGTEDGRSSRLVVLLPGRNGGPGDYRNARFAETAAEHGLEADYLAVDAHFGYYRTRTLDVRLREDVIRPARERGYDEIWLVGVSLGGVGSILSLMQYPEEVDAVLVLAPYLGEKKLVRAISDAGGPEAWTPEPSEQGFPWEMWSWVREQKASGWDGPPFYLGFGSRDSFAPANRLFAKALPEERVFIVEGGHDWATWSALWREFLASRHASRDD